MILAAVALLAAATAPPPVRHICWIDRVVTEGTGVRIILLDDTPVPADAKSVYGEVGKALYPETSGHDGCTVTVARKGKRLGVQAQSRFFAHGISTEADVRNEWIPAVRAR